MATITVTVIDGTGEPIEDADVLFEDVDDPDDDAAVTLIQTDEDGDATLATVNPEHHLDASVVVEDGVETFIGQVAAELDVSLAPFFSVAIDDITPEDPEPGDLIEVAYSVQNIGEEDGTQDIRLLVDGSTEDVDSDVSVGSGQSESGTLDWQTDSDDVGTFDVVVESDDDSDSTTVTVEGVEIPDSAVYHYPINERENSTVDEVLQAENGSSIGTQNISNNWVGGWAESGDGVDDHVELTILPDWVENVRQADEYWVALTIKATDDDNRLLGCDGSGDDDDRLHFEIQGRGDGEFRVSLGERATGQNRNRVKTTNSSFADGTKHRIVVQGSGTNIDVYEDGSELSTTTQDSDFTTNLDSWDIAVALLANNDDNGTSGNMEGEIDNVIFGTELLSDSEILDDYNEQPWS